MCLIRDQFSTVENCVFNIRGEEKRKQEIEKMKINKKEEKLNLKLGKNTFKGF